VTSNKIFLFQVFDDNRGLLSFRISSSKRRRH